MAKIILTSDHHPDKCCFFPSCCHKVSKNNGVGCLGMYALSLPVFGRNEGAQTYMVQLLHDETADQWEKCPCGKSGFLLHRDNASTPSFLSFWPPNTSQYLTAPSLFTSYSTILLFFS